MSEPSIPLETLALTITACCGSCDQRTGAYYEESTCNAFDITVMDYQWCPHWSGPARHLQSGPETLAAAIQEREERARRDEDSRRREEQLIAGGLWIVSSEGRTNE